MKITLSVVLLASSLFAQTYEGCGQSRDDALYALSGNIKSNVSGAFNQKMTQNGDDSDVQSTISNYINTSTNLSLVNIKHRKKDSTTFCASVEKDDQTKNAQKMLDKAMLYKVENLPQEINQKIKKLDLWIKDIEQLSFLLPVFMDDYQESLNLMNKKEKIFRDLYSDSIAKSNSLVFKSCAKTQEDAKKALNKKLFKNKGKEEKKGWFDSITSVFSSDEEEMIELFNDEISYVKNKNKECALIKKDSLFVIAQKMSNDVKRFNTNILDKNPKKRYTQIENYLEKLKVTKALVDLYPKRFNNSDYSRITSMKNSLEKLKKTTYPQSITFSVVGEQKVTISLDGKIVENHKPIYISTGEHSYKITAKEKCPIEDTFSLDLKDEDSISKDFTDYNYPTLFFITDKAPTITVDGTSIKPNVVTPIKKCKGELRYIAVFAGQTQDGELSISENDKETIQLEFLSSAELAVFNNAKTKNFKTTSGTKFSETLTPLASEKLEFVVEDNVEHGSLELHERGAFSYKSEDGFIGVDSFEFVIKANGKTSSPKVVNITVNRSNAPVAVVAPVAKKEDNTTKEEVKKEEAKKEEKKEEKKELNEEEKKEEKYQRFKKYVDSQEQNIEKLKKLQKTYPDMFERLLKEKTAP